MTTSFTDQMFAYQENLLALTEITPHNFKSVGGLIGLFREAGIEDREERIKVMKLIFGIPTLTRTGKVVTSTNDIPGEMIEYMIGQWLIIDSSPWEITAYGKRFLQQCKNEVKTQPLSE